MSPNRFTHQLSGIVLDQNQASSGTVVPSNWVYQTFYLPGDYARGDYIPALTGFQVRVTVGTGFASCAALDYTLEQALSNTLMATGTSVGCFLDGDVWFNIFFDDAVNITSEVAGLQLRLGLKGRTVSGVVNQPVAIDYVNREVIISNQAVDFSVHHPWTDPGGWHLPVHLRHHP
jgi:hypothetical protein